MNGKQSSPPAKPRIAVVSPFLDKRHGTERCIAEQVERLARDYEVHLYSNRVEDVNLDRIFWHRIPGLPGPHLLAYCWWFVANQLWRWWHRTLGSLTFDLIYTPGVNCLDADVVSVHAVFSEFYRRVQSSLKLRANPVRTWPLILHRGFITSLLWRWSGGFMVEKMWSSRRFQPRWDEPWKVTGAGPTTCPLTVRAKAAVPGLRSM